MSVKIIYPAKSLRGELEVPGDKSISHRAVMLGSIAQGTTEITHFLPGADCLSTIGCFRSMGIRIEEEPGRILVHGNGLCGLSEPKGILLAGNSGTTARLLSGILAGQAFASSLSGDESLNSRPMGRVITPLCSMGAQILSIRGNQCAPLRIMPAKLHGITCRLPVASAQVKSAVLLAGLYGDSETSVTEPAPSRNHTELMLKSFGADLCSSHNTDHSVTVRIKPCRELNARKICVPGDISSAAYFIAAGLLVKDSELFIKQVGINPTRSEFLNICRAMGADITLSGRSSENGEDRADLLVRTSSLKGTVIEGSIIPSLIDELPILAVLAAYAQGTTVIRDAAELKVKESNRIDAVTVNLRAMGANVTPTEDGMVIEGGRPLTGTHIRTFLDHRIAMSFAVAGLAAAGETILHDSQCVDISYPAFFTDLKKVLTKTDVY